MQIVGRTWLNLVTWTCGSWSEGQHDLHFTVQWFCLISWRLFDVWTLFRIKSQYDSKFDLKINVGHCDLHSMVQWFCLISWRLFDVLTLLFGIMSQYDPKFDPKMKTIWYMNIILWDYGSVWPDVWPQNKCKSMWPIFHGPVILSYISKTIWCMSVIFSDNETVWLKLWPQNKYKSTWPIFHGLVILLNIFKIILWMNIIVSIMDQCDT